MTAQRCKRCGGTGLLTYDQLAPHERERVGFGSVWPCPDCRGYDFELRCVDAALNATERSDDAA